MLQNSSGSPGIQPGEKSLRQCCHSWEPKVNTALNSGQRGKHLEFGFWIGWLADLLNINANLKETLTSELLQQTCKVSDNWAVKHRDGSFRRGELQCKPWGSQYQVASLELQGLFKKQNQHTHTNKQTTKIKQCLNLLIFITQNKCNGKPKEWQGAVTPLFHLLARQTQDHPLALFLVIIRTEFSKQDLTSYLLG